jgi:hypothetical protein
VSQRPSASERLTGGHATQPEKRMGWRAAKAGALTMSGPLTSPVENGLPLGAMAGLLRIFLLIANVVFFAWLSYVIDWVHVVHDADFWLACGVLTCLALNFVYLLLSQPRPPNWRIFRLVSLWLDEFRRRADQSRQGK